MNIATLIERIRATPGCSIDEKPRGLPRVTNDKLVLPAGVIDFFGICGGARLFLDARFGVRVVGPEEVVFAHEYFLGEEYRKHRQEYDQHPSSAWYLIARGTSKDPAYVIDLSPSANGRCFDAFWDTYAMEDTPMVATSFEELIERLLVSRGETPLSELGT